ncbi:MAG: hypothetical protein LBQ62_00485 [Candidatus Accumulibacter sp.]|jgi:WD40 repeat protein|nr:hypothetical protein [Accumulibacter sp.]
MKLPRFELTRVYEDGTQEPPRIFPVTRLPWETKMDRRGFLGAAVMAGAALAASPDAGAGTPKPAVGASAKKGGEVQPAPSSDLCQDARAHSQSVRDLLISPDGKLLVSIGIEEKTVKLWSLPDGALVKTLEAHPNSVRLVAIGPDGKALASSSVGSIESLKLWSLPDGAPIKTPENNLNINSIVFSRDGKLLAEGWDNKINVWSLPDGKLVKTLEGHESSVLSIAISPDGKLLASGSEDRTVRLWRLPDGVLMKTLNMHRAEVGVVAMTLDGKLLASRDWLGSICLLSLQPRVRLWGLWTDYPLVKMLEGQEGRQMRDFTIAPDGKLLASGGRFRGTNIELWSLPDGAPISTLKGHEGNLTAIAIGPDGGLLASGSTDRTVRLWRLPDGHPLATLKAHEHPVGVVAISPDGKLLASGDGGGFIRLWRLPDGKRLGCLIDLAASSSKVKGSTYTLTDSVTGQAVTYTLPCGSPIPPGAACVCNCVPGSQCQCVGVGGGSGGGGSGGGRGGHRCVCMAVRCR